MDTKGQFPLELECSANLRTRIFAPLVRYPGFNGLPILLATGCKSCGRPRVGASPRDLEGRPLCRPDYNGTGRRPSLQINIARGAADPPNPQWRDGQDAKFSATDGHGFTQIKTKAGGAKMFFSFAIRVSSV
jgi:hypothetical protein